MLDVRGWNHLKLYERNSGLLSYVERLVRKAINRKQRQYICNLKNEQLLENTKYKVDNVIISLTSFPARIDTVDIAIKSLLHQTVAVSKIILWLSKEQFRDVEIPQKLLALCNYGLEICFCNEDILAHKKYYYSMQKFPDKVIITYDDDLIYPEDSVENLLKVHRQNPEAIVCNRGREIKVDSYGAILPYSQWDTNGRILAGDPSFFIMASTGAGTLYPAGCMPNETFDVATIRELALTADDLWMKVMSIMGDIPVVKTCQRNKALCTTCGKRGIALADVNVGQNRNDSIMNKLMDRFPVVKNRLLEEREKRERAKIIR